MAYPRYRFSRRRKIVTSELAGVDYSIGSVWAEVDSTNLFVPIRARNGDELYIIVSATMSSGLDEELFLDVSIGGVRIGGSNGLYIGRIGATRQTHSLQKGIVLGFSDIGTDNIAEVSLWAKTSGTSRTMYYNDPPVVITVENIGPTDDKDE